jgi:hypothetical protein
MPPVLDTILGWLNSHIDIKLPENVNIVLFSNNRVEATRQQIIIDPRTDLTPEEQAELKMLVRKSLYSGIPVMKADARRLLEDFQTVDKENQKLVSFFQGKIPPNDLEALRASLYMRHVYRQNEHVDTLKKSIAENYGSRGRVISNMTTANYFEDLFKPLYEDLSLDPTFTMPEWNTIYELLITQSPHALFVQSGEGYASLKDKVVQKMEANKRYGMRYFALHGIGIENSKKIKRILEDQDITQLLASPPQVTVSGPAIAVKLRF